MDGVWQCSGHGSFPPDLIPKFTEDDVAKVGLGDKKKKSATHLKKIPSTIQRSEHASSALRSSSHVAEESLGSQVKGVRATCVVAAGPGRATVALELDHNEEVPRDLLRVLRLCAPFNPLLTRFSARWSGLEPGVLRELVELLPLGNISDVRLDNTHAHIDDWCALLDAGRLRRLSLSRCQLGDEGCTAVAEALAFPRPASRTLIALSLAGNAIGDVGALALARALRSNRTLRLLDLADNRLRDEGALAILRALAEFPLTLEEILAGRRLRMERVLRHAEALRRCRRAVRVARTGAEEARERRRLARLPPLAPRSRPDHDEEGCEASAVAAMAARELGPTLDPFPPEETVERDGVLYSRGNMMLNCLNLAYNSLSVVSLRALLRTLRGQVAGAGGLVRAELAGNPLPVHAPEYEAAAALLERALNALVITNKQQLQQQQKKKVSKKSVAC